MRAPVDLKQQALWPLRYHYTHQAPGPTMASSSNAAANLTNGTANIITALGSAFKTVNGEPLPGDKIAQLLLQNMPQLGELAKQGKLNQQQIMQVTITAFKTIDLLKDMLTIVVERIRRQAQSSYGHDACTYLYPFLPTSPNII